MNTPFFVTYVSVGALTWGQEKENYGKTDDISRSLSHIRMHRSEGKIRPKVERQRPAEGGQVRKEPYVYRRISEQVCGRTVPPAKKRTS